jgi:hypothetical protein
VNENLFVEPRFIALTCVKLRGNGSKRETAILPLKEQFASASGW